MQTVRAAVIGCGGIASEAHIPNCFAIPDLELVALCDRNPEKLAGAAEKFGISSANTYTSVDSLCKRDDIDAVLICTPASTHADVALKAAKAGKHAFVEKPLAANIVEAREVVAAFAAAKLKLAVGYYLEFMPHHKHVRDGIRAGKIGEIIGATIHDEIMNIKPEEGIILDLSTHYVDLLRWYFDESRITGVFAACRHMSSDKSHLETVAEMKLFFSSGVIGNVDLYWVPGFGNRDGCTKHLSIIGTEGRYQTGFTTSQVEVYRGNSFLSRLRGPYEIVPKFVAHPEMPVSATSFRRELESFIQSIIGKTQPEVSGDIGMEVMKVIGAAYKSISEKRVVSPEEV